MTAFKPNSTVFSSSELVKLLFVISVMPRTGIFLLVIVLNILERERRTDKQINDVSSNFRYTSFFYLPFKFNFVKAVLT